MMFTSQVGRSSTGKARGHMNGERIRFGTKEGASEIVLTLTVQFLTRLGRLNASPE